LVKQIHGFRFSLVVLLLISFSQKGIAGPPFFTDDPVPVELHHWEIYFASQYLKTADNRSGTAPHMEVNYGAYPNLQLHVVAPAAFSHSQGGNTAYGYGDTELGAKYRFIQETDHCPHVGTFPLVEVPTGDADRGLGNAKTQVFLPLWLQKSWGPWAAYGGAGYWINPGEGHKNWVYAGWVLQRDLSKTLTLGAELFHRTPDVVGGDSGTGFTGGGQVNLGEHYHLLLAMGRDFSGPNHFTRYLALQWTF
jgi:hypothetical protein